VFTSACRTILCVDPGVIFCQAREQKLQRIAHSLPVAEEHDAIGLTQRIGNAVVEGKIFRRALSTFVQLIAMVEVMQKMMRRKLISRPRGLEIEVIPALPRKGQSR
jgi:hypothetical protein